ncbi:hypothetical protein B9Z19DRAFT_1097566 [Tuber borchii]|uniref:Uncharacterized protein n=1 Tax=Tuber borchii TaxID=42251 RepID=A0A2T6Z9W6_TUBBO|nr:hypothetical protein B9Z19DRAFT_1097566 [Tuber borchii]
MSRLPCTNPPFFSDFPHSPFAKSKIGLDYSHRPAPSSQPGPRPPRPRQRNPEHMLRLLPTYGAFIPELPPPARSKLRFQQLRQQTLLRRHLRLKLPLMALLKRSSRLLLSSQITISIYKSLQKGFCYVLLGQRLLVAAVEAVCIVKGKASLLRAGVEEAVEAVAGLF